MGQARSRLVCGDTAIAPGVTLLATPGHAPGHQSVLVEGGGARAILVGQAAWSYEEFRRGVAIEDACTPEWHEAALASLERLRNLGPRSLYFSHDPESHRIA